MKNQIVDLILDGTYEKFKETEDLIDSILDECGGGPGGPGRRLLIDDEDEWVDDEVDPVGSIKKEETEYHRFFKSTLNSFNVKSPSQLSPEKRKEFFSAIKKGWKNKK